ncbi:GGDEF domain-containing protein [Pelagibacterium lentulum]|uniref:GGDEF domain-containing protein n=2 Tax=Pelagibacterium lentulum TaxID=2029865 RepID=A0A916R6U6_9HYPH|nr:GGDEF domain-containing protein [Pelagibacterium lentulum]GGA37199.1 GGDEF domain-containing protein [Pelagibacterium lentulum]
MMNGALFVLGINIVVAGLMAASFYSIAYFDRFNRSAHILAIGFMVGALTQVFELLVAGNIAVQISRLGVALGFLSAQLIIIYAIAMRLGLRQGRLPFVVLMTVSTALYLFVLEMPGTSLVAQFLYQLPYATASLYAVYLLLKAHDKLPADWLLTGLFLLAFIQFLAKPFIALWTDGVGGQPTDYMSTFYALISQSMGTILVLSIGLLSLLLAAKQSATTLVQNSERDINTGLLNQRGFELNVERWLDQMPTERRAGLTAIQFDCDLPIPFPDNSLQALAAELTRLAGEDLIVGRTAPLVFSIFEPDANLFAARRRAEHLRKALSNRLNDIPGLNGVSIGITEREPADSLMDMTIRSQWALAEARRAGGNCVRLAARSEFSQTMQHLE